MSERAIVEGEPAARTRIPHCPAALSRSESPVQSLTSPSLRLFAAVLAALGLVPVANWLTAGHSVPWWGNALGEWLTVGLGVIIVAAGLAYVGGEPLERLIRKTRDLLLTPSSRVFALMVGALTFGLAAWFARYCFAGQPSTGDEIAQRWHSHILMAGRVFLRPENRPEFFSIGEVLDGGGRWFSQFPVGGPAIMVPGLALGAAWLVNPLLAGWTASNVYRFASRTVGEPTARIAALLFATSPFVLIMSASQMNHVATLAFVSLALARCTVWIASDDASKTRREAVIIGAALGASITIRPLDGALVALALGVFQIAASRRSPHLLSSLLWQAAAGSVPVAILLWVNAQTTGSPFLFAYDALNGAAHRPGFHIDPLGVLHTPRHGLVLVSSYLMKLNRYLFEWPIPGLAVIVATLATLRNASRWDVLLGALVVAFCAAYGAYWFDGFFAGPRFLYTAVPAFVLFAARAPSAFRERFASPVPARAATLTLGLCAIYSWIVPTGVSSVQMRAFYYRSQWTALKTDIREETDRAGIANALVFVNDGWHARLVARLRATGMRPLAAEQTVARYDACALETALDHEDSIATSPSAERAARIAAAAEHAGAAQPVPGLSVDRRIALVPGSVPTPRCLAEYNMDLAGTSPFPLFFSTQSVDRDGRVGGRVVFARDFGSRNELIRARFAGRAWYRYRPSQTPGMPGVFVPYASIAENGSANIGAR